MRATKLITCKKHLTYAERLSYLNLPTLYYRRLRGDLIMVFKIVTGIIDHHWLNWYQLSLLVHTLLHRSMCSITLQSFHFLIRVVPIWNSLHDYVVSACSDKVVESRLDTSWRPRVSS